MSEFLQEFHPSRLLPSLGVGLIMGTVASLTAITYAAFVFSGDLESHLRAGVGLALVSAAVLTAVTALGSSYPGTIAMPQDAPAIILALMAASIVSGLGGVSDEELLATIVTAIALSTLLTGVFLFGMGLFRIGGLIRFIPFPVVGGFRAGVGWLLLTGSFSVMTGQRLGLENLATFGEAAVLARWLPGLAFALVTTALFRWTRRFAVLPAMLAAAVVLFYLVLAASGTELAQLRAEGWFLGPFPEADVWRPVHLGGMARLDWELLSAQMPKLGSMMLISVLALLLYASAIELAVQRELDLNRELMAAGLANVLAGLAGGLPGYHAMGPSSLTARLGARNRMVGVTAALLCIVALIFGVTLVTYLPRPVMGGLLMYLGLGILIEQIYEGWFKLPRSDHFVIVLILVIVSIFGYLQGIVVGLMAGLVLFVVNYSRVSLVKLELSGDTHASNVERPEAARRFLREKGGHIHILKLQGYLFFGTANRLLNRLRRRLAARDLLPLRYLVLDFRLVNGLDSSALISFIKMKQRAEQEGFKIILSALPPEILLQLRRGDFADERAAAVQVFADMYQGLEWCEDDILVAADMFDHSTDGEPLADQLKRAFPDRGHAAALLKYLEKSTVEHGEHLMRQGEPSVDLYFVESGRVTVQLEGPDGSIVHLRTMGPGTVVGEAAFVQGLLRTASVVTESRSTVYRLTSKALKRMKRQNPLLANALHEFIARLLAERLADTNKLLQAVLQ